MFQLMLLNYKRSRYHSITNALRVPPICYILPFFILSLLNGYLMSLSYVKTLDLNALFSEDELALIEILS